MTYAHCAALKPPLAPPAVCSSPEIQPVLCEEAHTLWRAMQLTWACLQNVRPFRNRGLGTRRMIMSYPGIHFIAPLSRASPACVGMVLAMLVLASGIGRAASATEDCSTRYKVCNGGCDRPIERAAERVLVCKTACDFRLIACDREPVNASVQGGSGASPPSRPLRGVEGPLISGRDGQ
jgi:hypothetical protein